MDITVFFLKAFRKWMFEKVVARKKSEAVLIKKKEKKKGEVKKLYILFQNWMYLIW